MDSVIIERNTLVLVLEAARAVVVNVEGLRKKVDMISQNTAYELEKTQVKLNVITQELRTIQTQLTGLLESIL